MPSLPSPTEHPRRDAIPSIVEARLAADLDDVRALLDDYRVSLGIDLEFQGFGAERAGLPGAYAAPRGTLLLARVGGQAMGCVAVRPLDDARCEMKRLYVRPAGRGRGLGRALAERAIAHARGAGYARMLLDTLPAMGEAQTLYAALGFVDVAPYRENPVPGSRFLALDLSGRSPRAPA